MAMSCKAMGGIAAAGTLLLLGGCDTVLPNGSTDRGFGEVARYNAALQIIDPDPVVAAGAAMPGANGAVGAAAAKRYRTDSVKKLEKTTSSIGTAVSSGSDSGGSR